MRSAMYAAFALLLGAGPVPAQSADRIDRVSARNFETTVKQLETALQGQGFMIVSRADHQNMLKMVGATVKGARTIDFGRPDMMKMHLPAHPEIGLEMPMRFYLWERGDGKTVVSYRKPSAIFGGYGSDDLKMMGGMMDGMFDQLATAATK